MGSPSTRILGGGIVKQDSKVLQGEAMGMLAAHIAQVL